MTPSTIFLKFSTGQSGRPETKALAKPQLDLERLPFDADMNAGFGG